MAAVQPMTSAAQRSFRNTSTANCHFSDLSQALRTLFHVVVSGATRHPSEPWVTVAMFMTIHPHAASAGFRSLYAKQDAGHQACCHIPVSKQAGAQQSIYGNTIGTNLAFAALLAEISHGLIRRSTCCGEQISRAPLPPEIWQARQLLKSTCRCLRLRCMSRSPIKAGFCYQVLRRSTPASRRCSSQHPAEGV